MISEREIGLTYPQPVAYAFHQTVRSISPTEKFDSILRCGEVISRYLCSLALASFAARDDLDAPVPDAIKNFRGSLSYGKYLAVVQAVARFHGTHPLQAEFQKVMYRRGGITDTHEILVDILERRNEWGHNLTTYSNDMAAQLLEQGQHVSKLNVVLEGILPLCLLPLIYIDQINFQEGAFQMLRLLLMELNDEPAPHSVTISLHDRMPNRYYLYLGTSQGLLRLYPMMLWALQKGNYARSIYLLDKITSNGDKLLEYQSIRINEPDITPHVKEIEPFLTGEPHPPYPIQPKGFSCFVQEWLQRRKAVLSGDSTCTLRWETLNQDTLKWYARILGHKLQQELAPTDPYALIVEYLLNGSTEISQEDWYQISLLFGKWSELKTLVNRDYILDIRQRVGDEERWVEREMVQDNVVNAFRTALKFITRANPGLQSTTPESLDKTSGSSDYIMVREALVNLSTHQDYTDKQMAAQIQLEPHVTRFSNPGSALISVEQLIDGGLSVARNPLIGKAFRLIGFAELAGTGLRTIHHEWRKQHRRPPQVISHENHFSLILDDRPLELASASWWADKLGKEPTEEEVLVLSHLKANSTGLNLAGLCSATGFDRISAENICQDLIHQGYVQSMNNLYRLEQKLRVS